METLWCRECGSPLGVEYLQATGGDAAALAAGSAVPLPLHGVSSAGTLGEGETPCVDLAAVRGALGLQRLWGKLEYLNPTGSFKDRGSSVMMAVARELGVTEVVEDSSGNAGASVSAYAARNSITAHIFAPSTAPAAKVRQIAVYGAQLHSIDGSREEVAAAAAAYSKERRLVYASHALSPYFLEGTKTFAYEVARRFGDEEKMPDHIVFPVGNGSLLIGAWKGFTELRDAGNIVEVPRLHVVQSRSFMPVVSAYRGEEWNRETAADTVAGGIAVAAPARRAEMIRVLGATDGVAVAVDDSETLRWQELLAKKEGIFAEPTSAAAFAGLAQLVDQGVIGSGESVLVPVTGFGLKDDGSAGR